MALEEVVAENNGLLRELIGLMRNRVADTASNGSVSEKRETVLAADKPVEAVRRGPGRPPREAAGPGLPEVTALAQKVKSEIGEEEAKALIAKHGKKNGATKLAGLDKTVYAAFVAEAEVLLKQHEEGETDADDDDGL